MGILDTISYGLNKVTCGGWSSENKVIKVITRTVVAGGVLSVGTYFGAAALLSKFTTIAAGTVIDIAAASAAGVGLITFSVNTGKETCCASNDDDAAANNDTHYTAAPDGDPEQGQQRNRNTSHSQFNSGQFNSMLASTDSAYAAEGGDTVISLNGHRNSVARPIMAGVPLPSGAKPTGVGSAGGELGVGSVVNKQVGSNHSNPNAAGSTTVPQNVVTIKSPTRKVSGTGSGAEGTPGGWASMRSASGGLGRGSSYVPAGTAPAVADKTGSLNGNNSTAFMDTSSQNRLAL